MFGSLCVLRRKKVFLSFPQRSPLQSLVVTMLTLFAVWFAASVFRVAPSRAQLLNMLFASRNFCRGPAQPFLHLLGSKLSPMACRQASELSPVACSTRWGSARRLAAHHGAQLGACSALNLQGCKLITRCKLKKCRDGDVEMLAQHRGVLS